MTAPGESLEFQASGQFRDRMADAPEILDAVKEALRDRPTSGGRIGGGEFFELGLVVGDADLVVSYRKRRNVVGLLALFLRSEQVRIEAKRRELCEKPG